MNEGLTAFDLILLLGFAAFIYTRFAGNKLPTAKKQPKADVVKFPQKEEKADFKEEELSGMDAIKQADPSFKEKDFLSGARSAYSMYFEALSNKDEELLDEMLAPRIFDTVMEDIEALEAEGLTKKVDVKSVESVDIVDARVHGQSCIIDVKYVVQASEYTEGEKTSKAPAAKKVTTIWTWAKPLNSDDPNWELESINAIS